MTTPSLPPDAALPGAAPPASPPAHSAPHLAEDELVYLAALDDAEPERAAALAHTAACPECAARWREAGSLLSLLAEDARLEPVSPALERRVLGRVLGPPRRLALVLKLAALLLSLALVALDLDLAQSSLDAAVGVQCLFIEQGLALATFAGAQALVWLLQRSLPRLRSERPLLLTVAATTGALAGQLLLRVRCEVPHAGLHLLVVHFAGVAATVLWSSFAARLLVALGNRRLADDRP
ncbi:MAG: hypothetical protein U1F43_23090 [Myxococcota bacterium]